MINICKVPFVNSQESRDRSFKLYKIKFVKHSDYKQKETDDLQNSCLLV
jgi:hypothetical protein